MGIMLSFDEINAAPPKVRRWLEKHLARLAGSLITPDHSAPNLLPAMTIRPAEDGGISLTDNPETAPAIDTGSGPHKIGPATTDAAVRKLIAKRAYELWENQGRPHGCDMIHWSDAEQEIMNRMAKNRASSAISPPVSE